MCFLTRPVHYKVVIDGKGSLYWPVLVYLIHNLLLICLHAVRGFTCRTSWLSICAYIPVFTNIWLSITKCFTRYISPGKIHLMRLHFFLLSALFTDLFIYFTKVLVLSVARCVSRFTLVDAIRCVSMLPGAGGSGAIYVVLTGFDGVRTAACRRRYRLRGVNTLWSHFVCHTRNSPTWEW